MTEEMPSARSRPTQGWPLGILAVLLVAAGGTFWNWYSLNEAREEIALAGEQLDARVAELASREQAHSEAERRMDDALGALTGGQATLAERLDTLYGTRRSALLAAEAEHMVRLAAQRLALLQDPAGALALLTAADGAIRDIRDADTHAARAAIAADAAILREAGQVDVDALYLRLAALPVAVESIAAQRRGDEKPVAPAKAAGVEPLPPAAGPDWQSRLHTVLTSLVTIRRVSEPVDPAITDGARTLAAQNFRLLVEQAQIALLQRRVSVYSHSLAQADRWLARLAGGNPAQKNALHRELASLRAVDIGRPLPDLTASVASTRTLASMLMPEKGGAR